jgi:hypothetical protein
MHAKKTNMNKTERGIAEAPFAVGPLKCTNPSLKGIRIHGTRAR